MALERAEHPTSVSHLDRNAGQRERLQTACRRHADAIAKIVLLREILAKGLAGNADNPNVGEKYGWLARGLDRFVAERRLGNYVTPLMAAL